MAKAFKPGVTMTNGSPALLLARQLKEMRVPFTPHDPTSTQEGVMSSWLARNGAVYVIATANPYFADLDLASGSAVIDPHGMMPSRPGVTLITPGRER